MYGHLSTCCFLNEIFMGKNSGNGCFLGRRGGLLEGEVMARLEEFLCNDTQDYFSLWQQYSTPITEVTIYGRY